MSTPHDNAAEFYTAIIQLEFIPGRYDGNNGDPCSERKNAAGHLDLRIFISYEGESTPHSMVVAKFECCRSQITSWESRLSAYMPTTAIVATLQAL